MDLLCGERVWKSDYNWNSRSYGVEPQVNGKETYLPENLEASKDGYNEKHKISPILGYIFNACVNGGDISKISPEISLKLLE